MEISKIFNISFGNTKKPEGKNDKKITCGDFKTDSKTSKAIETAGKSQIIQMPRRKIKPESIEEICDYYISLNSSRIQKYKTGEIRPMFDFVSVQDAVSEYEEQNLRLEMMKNLDSERFLTKFSPKHDFLYTARNYAGSNELMKKNIEVLNSMDERLISKIKTGGLIALLGSENLGKSAAQLALTNDRILASVDSRVIMDYLCDTNVFSSSAEIAEYMSVLPNFDELPESIQQDIIDGKLSINIEKLREASGKKDAKIIQIHADNKK